MDGGSPESGRPMSGPTLKGKLLVAVPTLLDPNFARTVVLLLEHTDDGAVGVVLNRPSDTSLAEALPAWSPLASPPDAVHVGGPVAMTGALALARAGPAPGPAWIPVEEAVGLVDLDADPSAVGHVEGLRVFVGHAGWGPGQLEDEIGEGSWWVLPADPDDAFCAEPHELWRSVLRRQTGRLRLFAAFPPHVSLN